MYSPTITHGEGSSHVSFNSLPVDLQTPKIDDQPRFTRIRLDVGARADRMVRQRLLKSKEDVSLHDSEMSNRSLTFNYNPELTQIQPKRRIIEPPFPTIEKTEFSDDSNPYILTTEIGQSAALEQLRLLKPNKEGLYLGFAFEFNYHVLAERPVKFAWIGDINKKMHTIYQFIETTIVKTENKDAFIEAFRKELEEKEVYYFSWKEQFPSKVIDYYLTREFSWLYTEEKFQRIRNLYLNHQIQHVNLDLVKDTSFFVQLKKWADFHNCQFDIVYASNIPEWLQRTSYLATTTMKANLLQIMSPQTIFIDAKQEAFECGEPILRLTQYIQDAESFPHFHPARNKGSVRMKPLQLSGMNFLFNAK